MYFRVLVNMDVKSYNYCCWSGKWKHASGKWKVKIDHTQSQNIGFVALNCACQVQITASRLCKCNCKSDFFYLLWQVNIIIQIK
jgi:hypothetical protein